MVIVEDELSRTKKSQEFFISRAKRMKELGAPSALIENDLRLSKMSHREIKLEKREYAEWREKQKKEFTRNNPMREEVVNTIFKWFDEHGNKLEGIELRSRILLNMKMHPLSFMTEEEFDMDLYSPLIDGVVEQLLEQRSLEEASCNESISWEEIDDSI